MGGACHEGSWGAPSVFGGLLCVCPGRFADTGSSHAPEPAVQSFPALIGEILAFNQVDGHVLTGPEAEGLGALVEEHVAAIEPGKAFLAGHL